MFSLCRKTRQVYRYGRKISDITLTGFLQLKNILGKNDTVTKLYSVPFVINELFLVLF